MTDEHQIVISCSSSFQLNKHSREKSRVGHTKNIYPWKDTKRWIGKHELYKEEEISTTRHVQNVTFRLFHPFLSLIPLFCLFVHQTWSVLSLSFFHHFSSSSIDKENPPFVSFLSRTPLVICLYLSLDMFLSCPFDTFLLGRFIFCHTIFLNSSSGSSVPLVSSLETIERAKQISRNEKIGYNHCVYLSSLHFAHHENQPESVDTIVRFFLSI